MMHIKNSDITSVIGVGDLHTNATISLAPPSIQLDDGGTYRSSRPQRWLWECWLDFWQQAGKLPGRRVGVFNGDLGELDTKRRSNQIITANKATIQRMAITVLEPALDVLDAVYVLRGTLAHSGKSSWLEEALANDITINIPSPTAASWWHLRAMASGVRFDVSHHASMGSLPWSEQNSANKIASIIVWRYLINMKQPSPDIPWRSHNHRYADSGGNYETFAVCLPCWSLLTEFAHRTGKENDGPNIGGVWEVCQDGKHSYEKRIYIPRETRRVWALQM